MSVGSIKNAAWTTLKGSEPIPYELIWTILCFRPNWILRLHTDIYKFLYFRHCIWLQLSIQLFLDLCFVMFKSSWEGFLAVSSLPNQKNVQITRRQCKRDWHMHLGRLHPWERQNYRKLQFSERSKYRMYCIFVILAFATEVKDYGNFFFTLNRSNNQYHWILVKYIGMPGPVSATVQTSLVLKAWTFLNQIAFLLKLKI